MKLYLALLFGCMMCLLLHYSVQMWARWESQVNPNKGVVVEMDNGKVLSGDLSFDWDGAHLLSTDNGVVRVDNFRRMTIPVQKREFKFPWLLLSALTLPIALFLSFIVSYRRKNC